LSAVTRQSDFSLARHPTVVPNRHDDFLVVLFTHVAGSNVMGDSRDIQLGVNDPVSGVDVKHHFRARRNAA
jgi:hypothetical protein